MMNEEYTRKKLDEAKSFLKLIVGLKPCYFKNDLFQVFKEFGYVETLDLEDVPLYLPSKGYDFSSIKNFSNGFIDSNDYIIYAVRMEKHFNLFVVSFNKYREMDNYYSVTISEETLNICFILECMKNNQE